MSPLPRRLYAPVTPGHAAGLARVTKSAGSARVSPEAVITYPVRDLQGDVVEPGGIDWDEFNGRYERLVNLEHGPYVGTADVTYKSLPAVNKAGQPDEALGLLALPVGVTTFFASARDAARHTLRKYDPAGAVCGVWDADECARYAEQTYPLVADGTLSGVSLEFQPAGPEGVAYRSLGRSPNLPRDAYHFFRTRALGYAAACERPVNPFAGYPGRDPSALLAKAEKAVRVSERPGTLALVRKSLSPLVRLLQSQTPPGRVTAPVRRPPPMKTARLTKADEYEDEMPAAMGDAMDDAPMPEGDAMDDDMPATAAAALQGAQGASDLCAMIRDLAARGEHMVGRKKLAALCDQLDKLAAEYQAVADMVLADVGGDDEPDDEPDADDADDADPTGDGEPAPIETDETGLIQAKAFRTSRWRPERVVFRKAAPWTARQLKKAKPAAAAGKVQVDAEHLKNLETLAKLAMGQR